MLALPLMTVTAMWLSYEPGSVQCDLPLEYFTSTVSEIFTDNVQMRKFSLERDSAVWPKSAAN